MTQKIFHFNVLRLVLWSMLVITFTACIKEPKAVDGVMIRLHEEVFGADAPEHYHLDSLKEFYIQKDRLTKLVEKIEDRNTHAEALLLLDHFIQSDYSNTTDLKNILILKSLYGGKKHSPQDINPTTYAPVITTVGTYTDSLILEIFFASNLPRISALNFKLDEVEVQEVELKDFLAVYKMPLDAVSGKTFKGSIILEIEGEEHHYYVEKEFPADLHFFGG